MFPLIYAENLWRTIMETPQLFTERLLLILPSVECADKVAHYFSKNKEFHGPWDPIRSQSFYTEAFWKQRLQQNRNEFAEGKSVRFFVFLQGSQEIIGCCNFTDIIRGVFQCCNLGFSVDQQAQGHGYMTEALQVATKYIFTDLKLHRIQANHLPHNTRSRNLLQRLGFVVEGHAKNYLFINGEWRDHVLNSLTNPNPLPPQA